MATIYVPRSFGGTLILSTGPAAPLQYLNATWLTRDGKATWLTRDGKATWKTRDDLATWKARQ